MLNRRHGRNDAGRLHRKGPVAREGRIKANLIHQAPAMILIYCSASKQERPHCKHFRVYQSKDAPGTLWSQISVGHVLLFGRGEATSDSALIDF